MSSGTEKHIIGLAGEYLVAAQLCMKGWVANLTSKNCPVFDVLVTNPDNNMTTAVQVKSTKNYSRYNVGIGHNQLCELENKIRCPHVYVHIDEKNFVRYFIVPRKELIDLIRNTDTAYQNKPRSKPIKETGSVAVLVEWLECYENKWENIWI